ncbi:hypothetical protein F0562_018809 [Nyssa sinensis]|uniref:Subtilisin-like protease fibronectin type-III domain-containing protein n=1 Tax=Nyssa sinensis TaxID=561372 RepID=A0A5J4ZB05_9ASTE|nr:hypothetical protein F0562_018809 [Nyssa sinensis]
MGAHSHGPEITEEDLQKVSDSHFEFLGSFLGDKTKAKDAIFYSYRRHINGFAAILDEEHAVEIAKHPKVVSVFLNQERKLHTTHSWKFLSLENINGVVESSSLWRKANFGENIIIGNIDSGVWPESESFRDEGYGPIPSKWNGICETKDNFICNRKLIGARYFDKGYTTFFNTSTADLSLFSARDYEGHGSHTLSTAGGNFVPGASIFGMGNGTAKGGAPRARVATYKVCWPSVFIGGCFDADVLKGFDLAIYDGVDVLSVSLGGASKNYFEDSISIGAFHAVNHGIVVICSAGNSGPADGTVTNVSPWIITVGASTMDRDFPAYVELKNGQLFKGVSVSKPLAEEKFYPLITGAQAKFANASTSDALHCDYETLDPQKVKGKILVCLFGLDDALMFTSEMANEAGAVGTIICNDKDNGNQIFAEPHVIATSQINYTSGLALFAYINSSKYISLSTSIIFPQEVHHFFAYYHDFYSNPQGTIKAPKTEFSVKPSPLMASFSSKGPNPITPEILKPDIIAPGVDVIAAYSGAISPTEGESDKRRTPFINFSGTSMSCPHVSGVVALLKAIHPDWSPAAIRSAIMTTARRRDNTGHPILDASLVKATPFSYGAGHIRPNRAANPGLVYDLTVKDYIHFLCALGYNQTIIQIFSNHTYSCSKSARRLHIMNLNYPSITVPKLLNSVTVTRRVRNVGSPGKYSARVQPPVGVSVTVEPSTLIFMKTGEEKSFNLTLTAKRPGVDGDYVFGELIWSDSVHYVRSPIVVATTATLANT